MYAATGADRSCPALHSITTGLGSWSKLASASSLIRAGVGLFADQFEGNLVSRFFTNTPNVANFTTGSGIVAAPGTPGSMFALVAASNTALQQGFVGGATLAQLQAAVPLFGTPNLSTQSDNFHIPRYLEWNFEIQQEISPAVTVSVNYVGNHGWDEYNQNAWLNTYSTIGFGGLPTTPSIRVLLRSTS